MHSRRFPAPPPLPERPVVKGKAQPEGAAELEQTYRGYRGSRRKQRHWAASNPGNMAIRAEVLAAIREMSFDRPPAWRRRP